jgi:hypothetical protein
LCGPIMRRKRRIAYIVVCSATTQLNPPTCWRRPMCAGRGVAVCVRQRCRRPRLGRLCAWCCLRPRRRCRW